MKKSEVTFKVLGLAVSFTFGIISLVMEAKRKTILTEEDKDDIAEKVVKKLIGRSDS